MFPSAISSGSSPVQGPLWSRRASDWFEIQEAQSRALYDVILKALGLNRDSTLLDAGCGSGMFCELAAQKGASVMGLDASGGLLDLARRRAPHVTFFEGEMEELPFVGLTFDTVTMLNSLQHTATPVRALSEARRVLRPGGRLAIAAWARPEQCHIADFFRALDELLPTESYNIAAAFSFSDKGILHSIAARAGFSKQLEAEALTIWTYPDEDTAVRGLLSTCAAVKAIDYAGEDRVLEATRRFLAPYRLARGGFRLENAFRYLVAKRF